MMEKNFNQLGLIPGPNEEESAYVERVHYCLELKNKLIEEIPFNVEDQGSEEILEEPFKQTRKLFDIAPDWIPVYFSNYKLSLWHGGCAWIFQVNEDSPTAALFQLRQTFRNKKKFLGIYDRDELVAHELAHVGRMMFKEPKFEEFHAYRTATTGFRRFFGPIIQSAKESLFFVLLLLLVLIVDLSTHLFWVKLIPLAVIGLALIRLCWRHRQYSKCLTNLNKIYDNPDPIIYRLTDNEIIHFSKTPNIRPYIEKQTSLRWNIIKNYST